MSKIAVIIVAGGSGQRMGAEVPKQFLSLQDRPILMHTLSRFAEALPECHLILVLPHSHVSHWESLCCKYSFGVKHHTCIGGENRFESVKQGLSHVGDAELVAIHDGVRPLVSKELILRTMKDGATYGAVIPVITPTDSLREVNEQGSQIVDRTHFRCVQTPQVFHTKTILKAYNQPYNPTFTDDASVVETAGTPIYLCEGEYVNIKITKPIDLYTAEAILRNE